MELTVEDRLDLLEIPGRYGDAIDDRDWDKLRKVFTEDAVFDLTGVGSRTLNGIDEIVQFMEEEAQHPRTHMMTNIYANPTADADGWRVSHRETTLRRRDKRDAKVDLEGIAL